jgi:hypothetical protein
LMVRAALVASSLLIGLLQIPIISTVQLCK